jgi:Flp pilus assembly protein TadG
MWAHLIPADPASIAGILGVLPARRGAVNYELFDPFCRALPSTRRDRDLVLVGATIMFIRRTGSRKGVRRAGAAVEFAALLPFLIFLAVIGTDWARLFYYTIAIESAARTGALWAADTASQSESPYTSVTAAALSACPNLTPTPSVNSQPETVDGRPGVRVTVTVQFQTITNLPGVPKTENLTRSVAMRNIPVTPD